MLFFGISYRARLTIGTGFIDAANVCNSIAHALGLLMCQRFGVSAETVESILAAIEEIKCVVCTVYVNSKDCIVSTILLKCQEYCQGNEDASAG